MSNPNTLAVNAANMQRNTTPASNLASGLKIVHIGKDIQPVTIVKMVSVNKEIWEKSACFQSLKNTIYSLVESHSPAEVTAFVSGELPIDTGAAFQASQTATKEVMDSMLSIQHLDPVAFLATKCVTVDIGDPDDLLTRPDDIAFIKFNCTMDGATQDIRVTQADTLSFQFCLRLPQHLLDIASKTVSVVSAPVVTTKRLGVSRSLGAYFASTAVGSRVPPPSTPTTSTGGSAPFSSPAMKLFLPAGTDPTKTKKGFYGSLTFLDS